MVYLYNTSQCSHDYQMILESPFTFMGSLLLNYVLFCCLVPCNVASVVGRVLNSKVLVGIYVC